VHEAIDRAVERGDVDVTARPFAERARVGDVDAERAVALPPPPVRDEAAELARAEVRIQVAAAEASQRPVADDVAADDRAAAPGMRILEDRRLVVVSGSGCLVVARKPKAMVALEVVPAEVGAAKAPAPLIIDLLEPILADVPDQDPAAVEREPVGIAQSERVDLVLAGPADERVASR
jgi:hypothetical protein